MYRVVDSEDGAILYRTDNHRKAHSYARSCAMFLGRDTIVRRSPK